VIVTGGSLSPALAAKAATSTIPIVFNTCSDPVQAGLVSSINRPGGNATGVFVQNSQFMGKMMGLLHDLVPNARTIGVLVNPALGQLRPREADAQRAAKTLGLQVHFLRARSDGEIEAAFANLS
jgi:putative ABC transport system substrate-binding protein